MVCVVCVFFVKQKTAYEMRISDWSSDVCSSDLSLADWERRISWISELLGAPRSCWAAVRASDARLRLISQMQAPTSSLSPEERKRRSEEHTSELQSLMRISYAVFCLKKKKQQQTHQNCNRSRPLPIPYTIMENNIHTK